MVKMDNKGMKKGIVIIATLTIVLSAIAFSSVPVGAGTLTITDDFGRTVTIHGVPERIISLSPTNTEILFAIGAGDRVVGVTEYCNYPEEAKEREKIGGVTTVSIEKVVSLQPDLVLGDELNGKETFERLEELGITIVGLNPENISEILDDIMLVGRITGEEKNASSLVKAMNRRIEEIKNKTSDVKRPKVAHITWHDPIWVAGSGTVQDEMIEIAGGENAFSDIKDWGTVSLEKFIDRNPEVIIVSVGHGVAEMAPYEYILNEERLKVVDAVKNERVYTINADIASRAGPRIVDATETVHGYLSEFRTPMPSATPETSGFEAVLAIIVLLAVVYLSGRTNRF
ncbi:MAG: cobalamin-binding protein [Methanophagales archaeon ANME-1-THS]|nr:MAG: cobalamin-binding protein [Methanophagales archaeon ANME-1-THS]